MSEAAINAVREYLIADPDRCFPTCRVGCPCDGGQEDAATGAPDAAREIVGIVLGQELGDALSPLERLQGTQLAIVAVVDAFEALCDANNIISLAKWLDRLHNAMSDLATWHPQYNVETGQIENCDE